MKTKNESDLGSSQQTTVYLAVGAKLVEWLQNPELSLSDRKLEVLRLMEVTKKMSS